MKENNMSSTESTQTTNTSKNVLAKAIVPFLLGLVIGMATLGATGWVTMPGMMLQVIESRYDTVDETCAQLKSAIEAEGWSSPGIRNMNKTMSKHGVEMDRQIRIVELCKANYAKDVLDTNPEVATLMPCAWGVYEGADGKVYISGMNVGLMGNMFGGNIAKVMGQSVAHDEHAMLQRVSQY